MPNHPELWLRITVVEPPPGVAFAMHREGHSLIAPTSISGRDLVFEFSMQVADAASQPPRLVGPFAKGPPKARFFYINVGTSAGQLGSPWTRRVKVPLFVLTPALVASALKDPSSLLQASIRGTGRDGSPACASVPLLSDWTLAARKQ